MQKSPNQLWTLRDCRAIIRPGRDKYSPRKRPEGRRDRWHMSKDVYSIQELRHIISPIAAKHNVTKVFLFGSYARGTATKDSDIDLLVEFTTPAVSLFKIIDLRDSLEDALDKKIDVIHGPLPPDAMIEIDRSVDLYGS